MLRFIKGPTCFKDLLKVPGKDNEYYNNWTEACLGRKIIFDDEEWFDCLSEAAEAKPSYAMRTLFALILVHGNPTYPLKLWEKFKLHLSEDFIHQGDEEEVAIQKAYAIIAQKLDSVAINGRNFLWFVSNYGMPNCTYQEETEELPNSIKCKNLNYFYYNFSKI